MLVSFVEPSHNYNIILTPEELKELQETGHITIGRPSINKLPTRHYDVNSKRVSESMGHNLIFNDSPLINPDADRTVQFLTIGVLKEEVSTKKTCENCKHVHEPYESSICRICDATDLKIHIGRAEHTKWEPKEEPEEEKYCCDCKHVHTSDLDIPCAICNGHSKFEPKEEQKMDNRKTKTQLMEELEQKNAEIAELKKELERSANYEQYLDAAKEMRSMVDAFVESGFTEEQAIAIVTGVIGQATRQRI